jgi:copper(I)-binding protein
MPNKAGALAGALLMIVGITANVTSALAHTVTKGNIEIIHAWTEPSARANSMAHPTVSNEGTTEITLLSVESPVAPQIRLLKRGKEVDQIVIAAEDIIAFDGEPYSMELVNLEAPLIDGGQIPVTFHFSSDLTIDMVMVIGEATMMKAMDMGSMVKGTVPADGASLGASPREIKISFAHPMRLSVLQLSNLFGEIIPVEFDQAAGATAEIAVALPELTPDDYTVEWRAAGDGDHIMTGSFSFSVADDGGADMHHDDDHHDDGHHGYKEHDQ